MKKPRHLLKLSSDRTYCGITMQQIKEEGIETYDLTADPMRHTCAECDEVLFPGMLSDYDGFQ